MGLYTVPVDSTFKEPLTAATMNPANGVCLGEFSPTLVLAPFSTITTLILRSDMQTVRSCLDGIKSISPRVGRWSRCPWLASKPMDVLLEHEGWSLQSWHFPSPKLCFKMVEIACIMGFAFTRSLPFYTTCVRVVQMPSNIPHPREIMVVPHISVVRMAATERPEIPDLIQLVNC